MPGKALPLSNHLSTEPIWYTRLLRGMTGDYTVILFKSIEWQGGSTHQLDHGGNRRRDAAGGYKKVKSASSAWVSWIFPYSSGSSRNSH